MEVIYTPGFCVGSDVDIGWDWDEFPEDISAMDARKEKKKLEIRKNGKGSEMALIPWQLYERSNLLIWKTVLLLYSKRSIYTEEEAQPLP